jgi:hypothetical protein
MGTYVPQLRNTTSEAISVQLLAHQKSKYFEQLLAGASCLQQNHNSFSSWIKARQKALAYNMHRLFDINLGEMAKFAKELRDYYPEGQ